MMGSGGNGLCTYLLVSMFSPYGTVLIAGTHCKCVA